MNVCPKRSGVKLLLVEKNQSHLRGGQNAENFNPLVIEILIFPILFFDRKQVQIADIFIKSNNLRGKNKFFAVNLKDISFA